MGQDTSSSPKKKSTWLTRRENFHLSQTHAQYKKMPDDHQSTNNIHLNHAVQDILE